MVFLPVFAFAQQHRLAIKLNNEWQQTNNGYVLQFTANNEDYCDYYFQLNLINYGMFRSPQMRYNMNIRPGHNSLFRLTPMSQSSYQNANYRYWLFRGNIDKDVNADFRYSLPVKTGDSIRVFMKENSDYTLIFDLNNTTTDTIYAARHGIVCNDNLSDNSAKGHEGYKGKASQITIYHNDGSFGEYKGFTTPLVLAGTRVEMGTPIWGLHFNPIIDDVSTALTVSRDDNVSIYVKDKTVIVENPLGIRISLYDIQGKLYGVFSERTIQIPVSSVGVYILKTPGSVRKILVE